MAKEDPFERAARREQLEEAKRVAMRARMAKRMRKRFGWHDGGKGGMLAIFGFPYAIWGLVRATNHVWGEPSTGKALVRFFFGSGAAFASFTVWVLFVAWLWLMDRD